jgi:hypothetical protein
MLLRHGVELALLALQRLPPLGQFLVLAVKDRQRNPSGARNLEAQ